ncbi:FHA domain-containing protein [Microlunatus parietis]|uniref:FHA domain-containing protein n=1 Tax=Microlunatus parietis TaxID=682979 RepID=A0A7Y9LCB4_9ACTN|nr:hypothetical protein [Microlunatus parietis]
MTNTAESVRGSGEVSRWRAAYTPGEWVVLSGPTSLVVLEPSSMGHSSLINTLWAEVMGSSSLPEVAERLAHYRIDEMASFAAFFWSPDGMRSLIRGGITVMNLADGKIVADGEGMQTWREVGLESVEQVRVDLASNGNQTLLELPLVVGVVTASSITLEAGVDARVVSPQAGGPVSAAQLETENADTELMSADADYSYDPNAGQYGQAAAPYAVEEHGFDDQYDDQQGWAEEDVEPTQRVREEYQEPYVSAADAAGIYAEEPRGRRAAPDAELMAGESLIMAVLCVRQHSNPPESISCRVCGDQIPPQNPRLVTRPSLAMLHGPDGVTAELDGAVVIGRAPNADRSTAENPSLMTVLSPGHDISRTHAQVEAEGWEIVVTDLHSTNGTAVVLGGPDIVRRRLAPGESMVVPLGSILELGDGVSIAVDPAP